MASRLTSALMAVAVAAAAFFGLGFADEPQWDACSAGTVGTRGVEITVIYEVVNGELASVCHGSDDPAIYRGWDALTLITTAQDRAAISSFAGYRDTGFDHAAYATPVASDNSKWSIAVDLDSSAWDPAVLRFVMAHEYAHVLTLRGTGPVADGRTCSHPSNERGCADGNRYMSAWVGRFWPRSEMESIRDHGWKNMAETARRCQANDGFAGQYAATNPAEDFAESFANFVFTTRAHAGERTRRGFFLSYPNLVAMRDRVTAAGLDDDRIWYDECG